MTLLRRAAYLALPLSLMACAHHRGGPAKADIAASKVTTIGVNAYLWRATLDTLSFMAARLVDQLGQCFLSVAELVDQALIGISLFDRIEVAALDIFEIGRAHV